MECLLCFALAHSCGCLSGKLVGSPACICLLALTSLPLFLEPGLCSLMLTLPVQAPTPAGRRQGRRVTADGAPTQGPEAAVCGPAQRARFGGEVGGASCLLLLFTFTGHMGSCRCPLIYCPLVGAQNALTHSCWHAGSGCCARCQNARSGTAAGATSAGCPAARHGGVSVLAGWLSYHGFRVFQATLLMLVWAAALLQCREREEGEHGRLDDNRRDDSRRFVPSPTATTQLVALWTVPCAVYVSLVAAHLRA